MAEVRRLDDYRGEHIPEDLREHHLNELVKELSEEAATLVRQEVELARIEIAEKARTAAVGMGMFTTGLFLVYLALGAFTAAAIFGLSQVFDPWASSLIVGAAYLVFGGILFLLGRASLRRMGSPVPQETLETIREDAEWLRRRNRSAAR